MFIKINNVDLYYEKVGNGPVIILLHGNQESSNIFSKLIYQLSKNYTVYAIDSRGHGRSSNIKSISYDDMANDIIQFIKELAIDKPMIYGFSDGGIIALKVALSKIKLSKIIISGANINSWGIKNSVHLKMIYDYLRTKSVLYKLMFSNPHIHYQDLAKIDVETIVLVGSDDVIKKRHTKKIVKNLKQGVLEIIPNETHDSYVMDNEKLFNVLKKYL